MEGGIGGISGSVDANGLEVSESALGLEMESESRRGAQVGV